MFDPQDPSPEIQSILAAEKALAASHARMAAALAAGKAAGRVLVQKKDSIRLEILNSEKTADVLAKFRQQIRCFRRGAAALKPAI